MQRQFRKARGTASGYQHMYVNTAHCTACGHLLCTSYVALESALLIMSRAFETLGPMSSAHVLAQDSSLTNTAFLVTRCHGCQKEEKSFTSSDQYAQACQHGQQVDILAGKTEEWRNEKHLYRFPRAAFWLPSSKLGFLTQKKMKLIQKR